MMCTSTVLVALASSLFPVAIPDSLVWKDDYQEARTKGSKEHKPLAVFIGSGPKGWEKRTMEGQLSRDAQELLQTHYVCVYLDTTTEEGQRLARAFKLEAGLVLSDGMCENQAFRHEGKLSNSDLERHLKKFSDPNRVATRTETAVREDVRYYPQAQEYYAPSGFSPYQGFPASGRSC
jgi:hypothetical protein